MIGTTSRWRSTAFLLQGRVSVEPFGIKNTAFPTEKQNHCSPNLS